MSAQLQWALVDGAPVSVYSLVGTKPDARPKGVCPACGGGTTWKIGDGKITPHVAHDADAECSEPGVTSAETAEHTNAKLHLARLFATMRSLWIVTRCRAGHEHRRAWQVAAWDTVTVEYTIGSTRPDLVLTSATGESAAVEILHSHAVDAAKAGKLAALGVPWIEVRAEFALAWTGQGAMRVHAADEGTNPPGCARCDEIEARRERERAERDARIAELLAAEEARRGEMREHEAAARAAEIRADLERQRRWDAERARYLAEQEARIERERIAEAEREARKLAERHDFAASRVYWDAVFAEPWAQEILKNARGQ